MHVAACSSSLFLFMSKCKYSELFINPLIDIYLAYFYCLTVVNRVAMSILTDICLSIHFYSSWINTQKWNPCFLGQLYVTLYNTLPQNFPLCSSIYSPQMCKCSSYSLQLTTLGALQHFNFSQTYSFIMVFYCDFKLISLMTDSVHFLSIFFTLFYISLCNISVQVFCPFLFIGLSLYCHMEIFIYLGIFFSVRKKCFANNFFQVVIY